VDAVSAVVVGVLVELTVIFTAFEVLVV